MAILAIHSIAKYNFSSKCLLQAAWQQLCCNNLQKSIPRKQSEIECGNYLWLLCTVKLGDKDRFDKEQIGVKEPFPMTNLFHKDKEHLALITKFDCTTNCFTLYQRIDSLTTSTALEFLAARLYFIIFLVKIKWYSKIPCNINKILRFMTLRTKFQWK